MRWAIYGPFRSAGQVVCSGEPAGRGTFRANGPGTYRTEAVRLAKPGVYAYQEVFPADGDHVGLTTPCNVPSERVRVEVQPRVTTVVSAQRAAPGASIFDRVRVTGLAGESVTVRAALYGPFAAPDVIRCNTKAVWTGTIAVAADGEYQTEPVTLADSGLLHVPRVDRRERLRPPRADEVRRGVGDHDRRRVASGAHEDQRPDDAARRARSPTR